MDQSIVIKYEVQRIDADGTVRKYEFLHPYGAPANEAFEVLKEIHEYIHIRVTELINLQNSNPVVEAEQVTHGN
jgi:hypothetical protein